MRVLVIGPAAPPMGGMARYAQDMLGSELARWHDMSLLVDNVPPDLRPKVTTEAFSWNFVRRDGVVASVRVAAFVGRKVMELRRRLREQPVDVVHVLSTAGFGFFRNAIHIWFSKRSGTKTIFHLLGQFDDLYRDAPRWLRAVMRKSLDLADVHIVQSPGLADILRGMTRRPVYSIFNGVRVADLAAPGGYARGDGSGIRVLSVGLLGHRKGTFDLLEVAARLRERRPDVSFTFVGGGEVDRFRAIAAERNLSNVSFLGAVDDLTRTELLQNSDIFVAPSHAEGQPIALLEAMAAGLPVISARVGSIPEVVRPDNGFLVTPGDVSGILGHVELLARDAALRERIGRVNQLEASTKYELGRVFREIDAVYQAL